MYQFKFLITVYEGTGFFTHLPTTDIVCCVNLCMLLSAKGYLMLLCISLIISKIKYNFGCSLATTISFVNCLQYGFVFCHVFISACHSSLFMISYVFFYIFGVILRKKNIATLHLFTVIPFREFFSQMDIKSFKAQPKCSFLHEVFHDII